MDSTALLTPTVGAEGCSGYLWWSTVCAEFAKLRQSEVHPLRLFPQPPGYVVGNDGGAEPADEPGPAYSVQIPSESGSLRIYSKVFRQFLTASAITCERDATS